MILEMPYDRAKRELRSLRDHGKDLLRDNGNGRPIREETYRNWGSHVSTYLGDNFTTDELQHRFSENQRQIIQRYARSPNPWQQAFQASMDWVDSLYRQYDNYSHLIAVSKGERYVTINKLIHPSFSEKVHTLIRKREFASACRQAFIEFDDILGSLSGNTDLKGSRLTNKILSSNNPVLDIRPLFSQADNPKSKQEGLLFLGTGSELLLRNYVAHNDRDPTREGTLRILSILTIVLEYAHLGKRAEG